MKNIILPMLLVVIFIVLVADPKPVHGNVTPKVIHETPIEKIVRETNDYYQKNEVKSSGEVHRVIKSFKGKMW